MYVEYIMLKVFIFPFTNCNWESSSLKLLNSTLSECYDCYCSGHCKKNSVD